MFIFALLLLLSLKWRIIQKVTHWEVFSGIQVRGSDDFYFY